jgi:hypothetical protein
LFHAYRNFIGQPEGKRPLGRYTHKWKDNIKTEFRVKGWGMDWIYLAQDRDYSEGRCKHGNQPSGSIKCLEIPEWLSD